MLSLVQAQHQQEQQASPRVSAAAAAAAAALACLAAAAAAVSGGGATAATGDGWWCGRRGLLFWWCCAPGVSGCSSGSSACGLGSSSCRSSCSASAACWALVFDVATLHAYVCGLCASGQLLCEGVAYRDSGNTLGVAASSAGFKTQTSEWLPAAVHSLVAMQTSVQLVTQPKANPVNHTQKRTQKCSKLTFKTSTVTSQQ